MNLFISLVYFSTLLGLSYYTNFLSDPHPWYGNISGTIMVVILTLLTIVYFYFLRNQPKKIWLIIIASAIIAFPAFPAAFSRDVYNYSFDSKAIVVYHQNPWTTPPKAHPNDPLLIHIHWPNDPSRYGPVWILPTTAIYAVFPSLFAFKLFTLICFLISLKIIDRMAGKKALMFVAFNPLMIIEFFVGTHTDIVMTMFILLALKYSWPAFLLSIGTKITSLPTGLAIWLSKTFHLSQDNTIFLFIWSAYFGALIIIAVWSINPWYFTLPFILSALYLKSNFHKFLAISLSIAAVVRYIPLLYMGPFDPHNKIRAILFLLFMVPFVIWTLKQAVSNIRMQIFALGKKATY